MGSAKVRRLYERRGIMDHEEQIKDALVNPDNSANIIKAGGVMGIIMLFYLTGLWCIYTGLFLENFTLTIVHIFAIGLVTFTINYLFLFKDGVYLNYFAEFNMLTKGKKKTYHFISLIL